MGLGLLVTGILLYVIFSALGIVRAGVFIIFPFFVSNNALSLIPLVFILSGFLLMFTAPAERISRQGKEEQEHYPETEKENRKFGGLVMIGPIPIIFVNDRKIIYILAGVAAAILLVLLLYYLR